MKQSNRDINSISHYVSFFSSHNMKLAYLRTYYDTVYYYSASMSKHACIDHVHYDYADGGQPSCKYWPTWTKKCFELAGREPCLHMCGQHGNRSAIGHYIRVPW